jgi:hypothetical protein
MNPKRKYVNLGDGIFVRLPGLTLDEMDERAHGMKSQIAGELFSSKSDIDEVENENSNYWDEYELLEQDLSIDEIMKSLDELEIFRKSLDTLTAFLHQEDLVDRLSSKPILRVLPKSGAVVEWGFTLYCIDSPRAAGSMEVWIHEFVETSIQWCIEKIREKHTPALCHLMACLSYMEFGCQDIIERRK